MTKRSIYIWKLAPIINTEGSVRLMIEKARRAKLNALWVKIADGRSSYKNVTGSIASKMTELVERAQKEGIEVWGWHVPRCANEEIAREEAANVGKIGTDFNLDGLIMDAEHGQGFFLGKEPEAEAYAAAMRKVADNMGKPLAISSHDIPQNFSDWMPKFNVIASVADYNFPQVYYGSSPSVENRLTRAEDGNEHVILPFLPVGAGWIGGGGGCASASACAERAREFIRLVKERGYEEYSFWHWAGAPAALWEVLNTTSA